MLEVSQEQAVSEFCALMEPYLITPIDPRSVIDTMMTFYRKTRVTNTLSGAGSDMVLLECGSQRPYLSLYIVDFRKGKPYPVIDNLLFHWVGLRRQIFAPENPEVHFDGNAISLSVDMYFSVTKDKEIVSSSWIETPDEIDTSLENFVEKSFVRTLLDLQCSSVTISIGYVG